MLTELLYQPIPQLKLLPPPPILLPEEPQLFIPDMSMDTLDGHMVTSLVSVKPNLTQLSMFSEELQSPLLEPSPLMLTEPSSQLIPQLLPLPPLNISLPKEPQSFMTLMQLSLMQDMPDTHLPITDIILANVKPKVMLKLTMAYMDLDSDMASTTSQPSPLLVV